MSCAAPAFSPSTRGPGGETDCEGRILLVDDDAVSLVALRRQLEQLGYRVAAVSDPRTAWQLFSLSSRCSIWC